MSKYVVVAPFNQSFDDRGLTYIVPAFLEWKISLWDMIEIPLWKKITFGVAVSFIDDYSWDKTKLKSIIDIKSKNILTEYQVYLVNWISVYYFALIHNSLALFLNNKVKKTLIDNKTLSFNKEYTYSFNNTFTLTEKQQEIYNSIIKSKNKKFLLHGSTWSWKTQIYINIIKYYLDKNMQSLLLVPEIILTNQVFEKMKSIFWDDVIIINSTITDLKKAKSFFDIKNNKAKIIIWTRSAIFYPYTNLWCIIIDEEHDNSYLSDQSPRYDTIEIANKISDLLNVKLILWSWTPKVNHMYEALNKKYELLTIFSEYRWD